MAGGLAGERFCPSSHTTVGWLARSIVQAKTRRRDAGTPPNVAPRSLGKWLRGIPVRDRMLGRPNLKARENP